MRLSDRARDRLERWADRMDTLNVIVQLIVGVVLVTLVDVEFVIQWRQGYRYPGPPILTLIVPILVTSGWLLLASISVRRTFLRPRAAHRHAQPRRPARPHPARHATPPSQRLGSV